MSLLSSEQRMAAIRQQREYDALLVADLDVLVERIAEVSDTRRAVKYRIKRFEAACSGVDGKELTRMADDMARSLMTEGIPHRPLSVVSGEKILVRAQA